MVDVNIPTNNFDYNKEVERQEIEGCKALVEMMQKGEPMRLTFQSGYYEKALMLIANDFYMKKYYPYWEVSHDRNRPHLMGIIIEQTPMRDKWHRDMGFDF